MQVVSFDSVACCLALALAAELWAVATSPLVVTSSVFELLGENFGGLVISDRYAAYHVGVHGVGGLWASTA